MKFKDTLQGGIAVMLSLFAISLIIATSINWISVQRLEHKVAVYKQESDAINIVQQWTILVKSLENKYQDIQLKKLRAAAYRNTDYILINSKQITQNSIDIDEISNDGVNIRIDEILEDIERIERIVE